MRPSPHVLGLALLLACSTDTKKGDPVDAGDVASGKFEVALRRCLRPEFGAGFQLEDSASVLCARHEDCTQKPHGVCIGLADGTCAYPDSSVTQGPCQLDSECTASKGGVCKGEIRSTMCFYDKCETTEDCENDAVCQCPHEDSDPVCVADGCERQQDCPSGETCRADKSFAGFEYKYCSTEDDECDGDAQCAAKGDGEVCGFDRDQRRWLCTTVGIAE